MASVTVGCVPPLPYAAGPGTAPADCGPTRSAWVSWGTCAIDPPPAPTVRTSTEVARTVQLAHRRLPADPRPDVLHQRDVGDGAAHVEGEQVLEPGSAAAPQAAPVTPPAGPDSSMATGASVGDLGGQPAVAAQDRQVAGHAVVAQLRVESRSQ